MHLEVRERTEIAKPPADVYRFIATEHSRNHPRWDAWAVEFTQLNPGPVAVGTRHRSPIRFSRSARARWMPGPQFLAPLMKGGLNRQVGDGQRRIKQLVESNS